MSSIAPLVTIGVPVYNGERYLATCLDSLLSQTYRAIEIIVCDNASTDRTSEIALAYARRDDRVRYHRNPANIGCPRNFSRVVELCRTPYFRWASVDDVSAPTFVARCVEVLEARADVVQAYPRTLVIDGDGKVTGEHVDDIHAVDGRASDRYIRVTRRLGRCNAIYGVMRTEVMRRTALLGPYVGSDIPFQCEMALHGGIWEVPEPLFFRRMHAQAQSAMSDEDRARHYDPRRSAARTSSLWRHLWERTRSVVRAPISWSEKARVLRFLARDAVMSRDGFAAELAANARRTVRLAGFLLLLSCARSSTTPDTGRATMTAIALADNDLGELAHRRVFFGHQSVGANIVAGIRALLAATPNAPLRVVHTAEPWTVAGPAFMESEIGRNGDPQGKTRAFAASLSRGMDEPGTIAFHKYCYIDMTDSTDVERLFATYRDAMRELHQQHPHITFAHVTMPLASDDASPLKRFAKRMLGRDGALALNRKRNRYNQLLLAEYGGREPVFDLATLESTRPDGSRSYVRDGSGIVYTLAPEYTYDGGHLTTDAERRIGARLLQFLAGLPAAASTVASAR